MTQQGRRAAIWLLIGIFFFLFLYEIHSILLPFVVGMLMAYFLNPAADRLEEAHIPRGLAAFFITIAFFLALVLAGVLVVPLIAHQCAELAATLPGTIGDLQARYMPQLENWLAGIDPGQADALRDAAKGMAGNIVHLSGVVISGALASGVAVLTVASLLLITPLVAFYLLLDWHSIIGRINRLLPVAHAATIREQMRKIDLTLAGFIRGQLNVCLIIAVYYGIALSLVGLRFGLVIGILSGVLLILPYIGIACMAICALTLGLLQFGMTSHLAMVGVVYLIGQPMEGYVLTPRLVGGSVGLHPLWIIFGMLSGAAMFGLLGVLIAVPVTAVIGVLIRFMVDRYLHSALYYGH